MLVFSFVGLSFIQTGGAQTDRAAFLKETVARVDGRAVSRQKLNRIQTLVGGPEARDADPDQLADVALRRLARLAHAEKIGIRIPKEVARQQYAMEFTNEDGTINKEIRNYIQRSLQSMGLSETDYIDFLHEELVLDQFNRLLSGYALVTPHEAERWAQMQTDAYTVLHAPLPLSLVEEEEIEVTDEELEAYFSENRESFRQPERRVASYLALDVNSFLDEIKPVTEEDARFRYDSRPEDYTREVESDEDGAAAASEPIPFDEVSEQIVSEISMERARTLAADRAADLAIRLMPARNRADVSIQDVAEEVGVQVQTVGPFRMGEMIEGFRNPFAFARAVFALDTTPLGRVAEPIQQGDQVLVAVLDEILEARLPELDEVRERVEAQAESRRRLEMLEEEGERLVEKLRDQIASGVDFVSAAEGLGLEPGEPESFQLKDFRSGMPQLPPALLQDIGERKVGDLFGPVETRTGAYHIGFLQSREPRPADTAELVPEMKNQLAAQLHVRALNQRFTENVLEPMIEREAPDLVPTEEADSEQ